MRGWSPPPVQDEAADAVVPARAGVVPTDQMLHGAMARGPRACGGGPTSSDSKPKKSKWSPRVRGWSRRSARRIFSGSVVPARAGVVPPTGSSASRPDGGPRACGGGPSYTPSLVNAGSWSPRVRGWSRDVPPLRAGRDVVPARAGVVPRRRRGRWCRSCGPRACGGGPDRSGYTYFATAWSPRVRGWSRSLGRRDLVQVVVPARAGVVPPPSPSSTSSSCGPRACGGGPNAVVAAGTGPQWSPRVRGWSQRGRRCRHRPSVVPARAGVVPSRTCSRPTRTCGPRACGGGPATGSSRTPSASWSPRVRGWSRRRRTRRPTPPVVPACGGGPLTAVLTPLPPPWSPRLRGWPPCM